MTQQCYRHGLIHSQSEQFKEGEGRISEQSALMTVEPAVFPLSKRDIAGIAGQVLDIRAVANQQDVSPEAIGACPGNEGTDQGISGTSVAEFFAGIDPTPADIKAIGEALLGYLPVIQADMAKLQQMDYSPPRLADVAPPKPKRPVSWSALFDGWLRSTGGVLEEDGYGVSQPDNRRISWQLETVSRSAEKVRQM